MDAWLSQPNEEGAVYWQVSVQLVRGRNEISVDGEDAAGTIEQSRAIGAIELESGLHTVFARDAVNGPPRLRATTFDIDERSDVALMTDTGQDVQVLDLRTGERMLILRGNRSSVRVIVGP